MSEPAKAAELAIALAQDVQTELGLVVPRVPHFISAVSVVALRAIRTKPGVPVLAQLSFVVL